MISIFAALLFQVSQGDPAQAAPQPDAEAAAPAAEQPAKPKVVCKRQMITGTRAKQATICHTEAYDKQSERQRDNFQRMLDGSANITPPTPPRIGTRGGG